ncbi:MAG TPA: hypothetical protein VG898_07095 [Solirubrobacterales bacterium]|nr:hypothetical protein [Solirubrobacterales bacterium]
MRVLAATVLGMCAFVLAAAAPAHAAEWQGCAPLSVTARGGAAYRVTDLETREVPCELATEIVRGFYAQEIGSSGAAEVEGFGCAYGASGKRVRVLCVARSGNAYDGPQRVRWYQGADGGVDPDSVLACRSFVVFVEGGRSSHASTFQAGEVRRSAAIGCSMTRKLLKAAYGKGPLRPTRVVYPHANGHISGRPTYWLSGGWRCGNGAGGEAACWNVDHRSLNAIPSEGRDLAVSATVRIRH